MKQKTKYEIFHAKMNSWIKIKMFLWKFTTSKKCPVCKKHLKERGRKNLYYCIKCGFGDY